MLDVLQLEKATRGVWGSFAGDPRRVWHLMECTSKSVGTTKARRFLAMQQVDRKSEIESHEVLRKVRLGYSRVALSAVAE